MADVDVNIPGMPEFPRWLSDDALALAQGYLDAGGPMRGRSELLALMEMCSIEEAAVIKAQQVMRNIRVEWNRVDRGRSFRTGLAEIAAELGQMQATKETFAHARKAADGRRRQLNREEAEAEQREQRRLREEGRATTQQARAPRNDLPPEFSAARRAVLAAAFDLAAAPAAEWEPTGEVAERLRTACSDYRRVKRELGLGID